MGGVYGKNGCIPARPPLGSSVWHLGFAHGGRDGKDDAHPTLPRPGPRSAVYELPPFRTHLCPLGPYPKERRMMVTLPPPPVRAGEALLRSSNPELRRLSVKE